MSSDGRIFTSFPRGNETFTLAEANTATTEVPFPECVDLSFASVSGAEHGRRSQDSNTPEAFVNTTNPGFSIATDKFLLVQAVVVDGLDRIWALDVGRPRVNGSTLMAATPGGPRFPPERHAVRDLHLPRRRRPCRLFAERPAHRPARGWLRIPARQLAAAPGARRRELAHGRVVAAS